MKISIKNFKSIGSLLDYEIKPMTILSGNNSVGKSSFIQLLLLLKQTIELDSSKSPLLIQGKYYSTKNQLDLLKDKDPTKELEISFFLKKEEFDKYRHIADISVFDRFPDYACRLIISYYIEEYTFRIKKFELRYYIPGKENYIIFDKNRENNQILGDTNNEFFVKGIYNEPNSEIVNLLYSGFFPSSYEFLKYDLIESAKKSEDPSYNEFKSKEYINVDSIKPYLNRFFDELYYIGPLRVEPKDAYPNSFDISSVGTKGEYVAQILEVRKAESIEVYIPSFGNDNIEYNKMKMSLLEATNFWMCKIFKFAKNIHVNDVGESYSIILVNNNNIETSIKHVGFGISQILPIIVQGLILNKGGTLILEQPEIHLHPKAQSLLFDFLYSLTLQDKNIIIETHSDHFITRMRRRIAEDETSQLNSRIKLTFIEQKDNDLLFRTLNLDEFGVLDIFPEDFIERPDIELKALLKAQMKKRISKKNK